MTTAVSARREYFNGSVTVPRIGVLRMTAEGHDATVR
jgi:hypothetical protein